MKQYVVEKNTMGLMVPESRVSVYDVLELYLEGESVYEIGETFNLSPMQVEATIEYIEEHRKQLEKDLVEVRQLRAKREAYHRAIADKIQKEIDALPMTPERARFRSLLQKSRQKLNQE